jgi:hypothetical protein
MKIFVSGDSLFSLSCSQLLQTLLPADTCFFHENGCRNCFHHGHLKKSTDQVTKRTDLVDKDELEITVDGQIRNLGSQCMSMLLYQSTGLVLKAKNI